MKNDKRSKNTISLENGWHGWHDWHVNVWHGGVRLTTKVCLSSETCLLRCTHFCCLRVISLAEIAYWARMSIPIQTFVAHGYILEVSIMCSSAIWVSSPKQRVCAAAKVKIIDFGIAAKSGPWKPVERKGGTKKSTDDPPIKKDRHR